jgi:hypothetical protein
MLEDLKALLFEARTEQSRKAAVMHASAREGDASDSSGLACADSGCCESLGDTGVKPGGNLFGRHIIAEILHERVPQVSDQEGCRAAVLRVARTEFRDIIQAA